MLDTYLTDEIDIVTTANDEWGVLTTSTVTGVKARIEDENRVVKNQLGVDVASNCYLMVDPAAVINYTSKIMLKKRNGVAYEHQNKQRAIMKLGKAHSDILDYWEVYL